MEIYSTRNIKYIQTDSEMKRVSIIIVTYNSEKHIFDCVDSLKKNADIPKDELELIIVDNNSHNPVPMFRRIEMLWGSDAIFISNTENSGYGKGNNVGINRSTAPIIMIINPDVRIIQPVFHDVLEEFEKHRDNAIVGMTQRMADGRIGRSTSWTTRIHPYIAEPLRFLTGKMNIYMYKYMYVCGACFFLRKDLFLKAGAFDENIFMYGEENDIHSRLLRLPNVRMSYLRHLSYLHLHDETTDFANADYKWMENNLKTLLYMDSRDGIQYHKTIDWAIKRNNISVMKERLKFLLTAGKNADRLRYYEGWTKYLKSKLGKKQ